MSWNACNHRCNHRRVRAFSLVVFRFKSHIRGNRTMLGQYGGLYQNYAGTGSNGDCSTASAQTSATAAGGGTTGNDESPTAATAAGRSTSKTGLRARLILPDNRPDTREKVHRIKVKASSDSNVDLRRDRLLCILGCCGRGRLMIVWSVGGVTWRHVLRDAFLRCHWLVHKIRISRLATKRKLVIYIIALHNICKFKVI